ncbi:ERVV2 protein, partial [Copsychus sechellarum]|nr:ERVV2 protein [Copsychus sechellarum]
LQTVIVNISAVTEHIEQHTADAILALQEEVHGLSRVVMQNKTALNFLFAHGGVCTIINTTCSYVNHSGRIRKDLA